MRSSFVHNTTTITTTTTTTTTVIIIIIIIYYYYYECLKCEFGAPLHVVWGSQPASRSWPLYLDQGPTTTWSQSSLINAYNTTTILSWLLLSRRKRRRTAFWQELVTVRTRNGLRHFWGLRKSVPLRSGLLNHYHYCILGRQNCAMPSVLPSKVFTACIRKSSDRSLFEGYGLALTAFAAWKSLIQRCLFEIYPLKSCINTVIVFMRPDFLTDWHTNRCH